MANMPDANASPSHPAYFRSGDWNELQDDDPVIMIPYENTLDQSSVLLVSGLVMLISTILLFFAIRKLRNQRMSDRNVTPTVNCNETLYEKKSMSGSKQ